MEPGVQSKFRMTERRNVIYRKYLQSVFCIALVLTVLTGCGKNTGQTSRSTEKKEIDIPIILTVDPTSGKKTEQDVVDAFNEEYAGTYHMQVEWIMETEEEYRKNLKRLNVTDELPAVIYDVRTLPSFYQMMVADGRIENLSPYLEEDEEWRNMIEPAVMEGCTDGMAISILDRSVRRHLRAPACFGIRSFLRKQGLRNSRRHGKNSGTAVTGCRQTESHRLDFTLKEPAGRRC